MIKKLTGGGYIVMVFRDAEGSKIEVYNWRVSTWAILFFSPVLYFAYKKIWSLFIISLIGSIFLVFVFNVSDNPKAGLASNFIFAFLVPHMLRWYYKNLGWTEISKDEELDDAELKSESTAKDVTNPTSVDELVSLRKLFDDGTITEDVFERKKKEMGFGD